MLSRRLLQSYTRSRTATELIFDRSYNNNRNNSSSNFHQSRGDGGKKFRGGKDREEDRFLRNLNFREGHGNGNEQRRGRGHQDGRKGGDFNGKGGNFDRFEKPAIRSGKMGNFDEQNHLPDDFDQLFPDELDAHGGNGKGKMSRSPRARHQDNRKGGDFNGKMGDSDEQNDLPDDFEHLFPDDLDADSGNVDGKMSENQRRRPQLELKEKRRSRFFEEDSEEVGESLRETPLSQTSRVAGNDPIADSLLHGMDMKEKKAVPEAEHVREPPLADEQPSVPEDVDEIFKKMKETGLIPNAVAMLDGLCKDGLVQEAMKLFGLMREKGTIPEVVIYTAVIEGFFKAAKYDDAKRIFKKMVNNGIVPNAFSYGVLIKGLCQGGQLEDAAEYCMEMLVSGHLPNAATFVGLVDGFCKEKGVEQAVEVVKRLHEKGFVLDDKAVKEHLEKKGPFTPEVWEAIFGKKKPNKPF